MPKHQSPPQGSSTIDPVHSPGPQWLVSAGLFRNLNPQILLSFLLFTLSWSLVVIFLFSILGSFSFFFIPLPFSYLHTSSPHSPSVSRYIWKVPGPAAADFSLSDSSGTALLIFKVQRDVACRDDLSSVSCWSLPIEPHLLGPAPPVAA